MTSQALALPNSTLISSGPLGSLEAYVERVSAIPMLGREEELELARRFHEEQDLEAARTLVLSHLRFVVHIARGYMGYGLPVGDLIQEGNVGLMKAVKRFDPGVGVRLVSFAVHWIRAEIHEFVIRARVEQHAVETWIAAGWLVPPQTDPEPLFSDVDLARAQLIRDLREDLGVNDEGVAVILHLLDQMHGLRGSMQGLLAEIRGTRTNR